MPATTAFGMPREQQTNEKARLPEPALWSYAPVLEIRRPAACVRSPARACRAAGNVSCRSRTAGNVRRAGHPRRGRVEARDNAGKEPTPINPLRPEPGRGAGNDPAVGSGPGGRFWSGRQSRMAPPRLEGVRAGREIDAAREPRAAGAGERGTAGGRQPRRRIRRAPGGSRRVAKTATAPPEGRPSLPGSAWSVGEGQRGQGRGLSPGRPESPGRGAKNAPHRRSRPRIRDWQGQDGAVRARACAAIPT